MTRKTIKRLLIVLTLALSLGVTPAIFPDPCMAASGTTQVLRDKQGRVLGKIKTLPNGKMELRDKNNRVLGRYDPKSDKTKDKQGRVVGKGNLLPLLIRPR